jgi:sulfofructose kinase
MTDMPHVSCVGIAALDVVFVVDAHPTAPGKYRAGERREIGGGVAANASVTVASLGGDAAFIGCVGDDATGDRIVAGLDEGGVDVAGIRRVAGADSPLSFVLVDATGERLIVNHAGRTLFDDGRPVQPDELDGTDAVLADMRWPGGAVPALHAAREAGLPTIVDCDHDPLVNRGQEILAAGTHVVFSLPTLLAFTGAADAEEALRRSLEFTDGWVAATAGDDGVYWLEDGVLRHLPAFVVDVVDTLGAGDVFHGAFALAIVEALPVERALRFASAAAALKCTRSGGRAGIPCRGDVESLLAEREP